MFVKKLYAVVRQCCGLANYPIHRPEDLRPHAIRHKPLASTLKNEAYLPQRQSSPTYITQRALIARPELAPRALFQVQFNRTTDAWYVHKSLDTYSLKVTLGGG